MSAMRLAAVVLAGLWLAGCDDPPPPAEAAGSTEPVAAEPARINAWPPLPTQPVTLAANPLATNYLVILDTSGSMKNSECSGEARKFDVARNALQAFADTLGDNDQLALAVFTKEAAKLVLPFGSGAEQRAAVARVLPKLQPSGATPLFGAIRFAFDTLTEQAQRQTGYGTYRMVVLTDGYSTDQDPHDLVVHLANSSPIEFHAIGFCVGAQHALNVPGVTRYVTADNPRQLAEGLAAVRAEIDSFDATTLSLE